jgi:hypothetical protein
MRKSVQKTRLPSFVSVALLIIFLLIINIKNPQLSISAHTKLQFTTQPYRAQIINTVIAVGKQFGVWATSQFLEIDGEKWKNAFGYGLECTT